MAQSSFAQILYLLLINCIKKVFYFPVWWYSKGFLKILKGSWQFIKDFNLTLGFTIWLKNIFVPMFGQKDIAGRLISFVLRLVQIFIRGVILLIICILTLAFIAFWLIIPIFIILKILTYYINA